MERGGGRCAPFVVPAIVCAGQVRTCSNKAMCVSKAEPGNGRGAKPSPNCVQHHKRAEKHGMCMCIPAGFSALRRSDVAHRPPGHQWATYSILNIEQLSARRTDTEEPCDLINSPCVHTTTSTTGRFKTKCASHRSLVETNPNHPRRQRAPDWRCTFHIRM